MDHLSRHMTKGEITDELAAFAARRDAEAQAEFEEWARVGAPIWAQEQGRAFTTGQRRKAAKEGASLPDGSYPIYNQDDADNAAEAIGRGKAAKGTIIAHIRKRVRALGLKHPPVAAPA